MHMHMLHLYNDIPKPSAAITKFSSDITMLDEVCGYLRHIDSGACVGADSAGILKVEQQFPCSNTFCLNTTTQKIRQESVQTEVVMVAGEGCILKLMDNKTEGANFKLKWRSNENGRICRVNPICEEFWAIDTQRLKLTISKKSGCNECQAVTGAQRFDFQRRQECETSGSPAI